MRWIDKLGQAQRVVVVVALGVALLAAGSYILSLGQGGFAFGWTGYAPPSVAALTASKPAGQWPGWVHLVVWLGLTCLWAVSSTRLLRPPRDADLG
jgi:hypothetical protein